MSKQNRVDPWGNLNAVSARGAWLGNRGILHNDRKEIVAPWRHKSWVTCHLEFQDFKREEIFGRGSYSELFFLDEATALSAGHRPCAQCRRDRFNEFKSTWTGANLKEATPSAVPISQIDKQPHSERALRGAGKVTFKAVFGAVPNGAFMDHNGDALLRWQDGLHKWSAHGYTQASTPPEAGAMVTVLTPASIVKLLAHGFKPQVHESAHR